MIGAGLAGLTAAYRLQQKEMDVEVYEARSRVGGRIFTVNLNGRTAELGAQNIADGGEAKNIHRLIHELNLELNRTQMKLNHFYFDDEKFISVRELLNQKKFDPQKLKHQLNDLISKSKNMKEILMGIFSENDPLYQVMAVRLAAYEGAPVEKLSPVYAETLYYMILGGISSVHQGNEEETYYVDFISIKQGNGLLPEKLAETFGGRMHLNMPLTHVSKDTDHSFLLTFNVDQKVKADILILAIPCSVYSTIVFEKNVIALERLKKIQNVQYGLNSKILVPFSHFSSNGRGFINDHMVCFFGDPSILTLYFTDKTSLFSNDTIINTYIKERPMLEKGFGEACPLFITPVLAEDKAFSPYQGPVGYSWPNDRYAKGSYSYISPGQENVLTSIHEVEGEKVKTLFAPIEQKLYFAGEHTSIVSEAPGTMEAACESGERIARMIIKAYS